LEQYFSKDVSEPFLWLFKILLRWLPQLFTFRVSVLTATPYSDFITLFLFFEIPFFISIHRFLFVYYFRQRDADSELA
jgi:hypothetical protein